MRGSHSKLFLLVTNYQLGADLHQRLVSAYSNRHAPYLAQFQHVDIDIRNLKAIRQGSAQLSRLLLLPHFVPVHHPTILRINSLSLYGTRAIDCPMEFIV